MTMHSTQGLRSSRKDNKYNTITNICSCRTNAQSELGTNSTGNIQCRQYILAIGTVTLKPGNKKCFWYGVIMLKGT